MYSTVDTFVVEEGNQDMKSGTWLRVTFGPYKKTILIHSERLIDKKLSFPDIHFFNEDDSDTLIQRAGGLEVSKQNCKFTKGTLVKAYTGISDPRIGLVIVKTRPCFQQGTGDLVNWYCSVRTLDGELIEFYESELELY